MAALVGAARRSRVTPGVGRTPGAIRGEYGEDMIRWLFGDKRLVGRWKSDSEKTSAEIVARNDVSDARTQGLLRMFGKLELRYTRWRCYSEFEGRTQVGWYRVVARDKESVVVVSRSKSWEAWGVRVPAMRTIQHIHFDADAYWITLGNSNIREFFRRVPQGANAVQPPAAAAGGDMPRRN